MRRQPQATVRFDTPSGKHARQPGGPVEHSRLVAAGTQPRLGGDKLPGMVGAHRPGHMLLTAPKCAKNYRLELSHPGSSEGIIAGHSAEVPARVAKGWTRERDLRDEGTRLFSLGHRPGIGSGLEHGTQAPEVAVSYEAQSAATRSRLMRRCLQPSPARSKTFIRVDRGHPHGGRPECLLTTRTRLAQTCFQRTLEQFDFPFHPSNDVHQSLPS